jgi:hypothetical protein
MNEAVDPSTVALATINQPFIPNTKPAMVTQVEYPIIGGNETKKVMNHNISQPAGRARHFFAAGARAWKIRSEKMRARRLRMKAMREKAIRPMRWRGVSWDQARVARRWSFSPNWSQLGWWEVVLWLARLRVWE